jgi:hypothetical protein
LKVIGRNPAAMPLFEKAGIAPDDGVMALADPDDACSYFDKAKARRICGREPLLRKPG